MQHCAAHAEAFENQSEREALTPVFCHVDVLAARSLPSSDPDSLADPCYEVRVEDQSFRLLNPARKTLNPSFLHRLLVPVQLHVDIKDGFLAAVKCTAYPSI